jgi:translation initiation factor 2B subunit (eIF-2B alpha/beta/delta family)/ADP-ribose pyrophosphatase YjhB (NUDIX family)
MRLLSWRGPAIMGLAMLSNPPELVPVVTAFPYRGGKVLLLRRSHRVSTYQGKWSGVSGYLERPPLMQARRELAEEVGVSRRQAALRGIGLPLPVEDQLARRNWLVFPFLFALGPRARARPEGGLRPRVRLDWESLEAAWARPEELGGFDTVPGLAAALARVWPPWGGQGFWEEMEAIASDTEQGATALALRGLRAAARLRGAARRRGLRAFAALHPSMGLFPHLAARALAGEAAPAALARTLHTATLRSAQRAAGGLRRLQRVLTHSASQACQEALATWGKEGREVVVTESRPRREGVAMARALAGAGLKVTLITEAQIGLFLTRCDALVVGADAITGDDHLINKAGTRLAVMAALECGVPAYAVAQTFKICPPGWPTVLTPQDPADVARVSGPRAEPALRASLRVANIAFDSTPLAWFRTVFTEQGPLSKALLARTRRGLARGSRLLTAEVGR